MPPRSEKVGRTAARRRAFAAAARAARPAGRRPAHRDQVGDRLLELGAQVLHQRGFDHRAFARASFAVSATDISRSAARCTRMRPASATSAGSSARPARRNPARHRGAHAAVDALGAAALEGQLGRHLRPARALFADERVVRQQHLVEEDLVEVLVAGEVADGPHGDAGQLQVDDDLRQALVPVFGRARGAHQRDHVVRVVCVRGPQLLPTGASRRRVRVARVRSPARSEPLCGSLMPMQKKSSAAQMSARRSRFCASVP